MASNSDKQNIHANHRSRMRSRFLNGGYSSMTDVEKLELLLYYAYSRCDTKPLAMELLKRFGTLTNVFNANYEELTDIDGIGESAGVLLGLIPELAREYGIPDLKTVKVSDINAIGELLVKKFTGIQKEILIGLAIGPSGNLISCAKLLEGSVDILPVHIREVAEFALRTKAASIIISHNHPSGNVIPSADDLKVTVRLYEALKLLDIRLDDHFLVAGESFVSFKKAGFLKDIFNN